MDITRAIANPEAAGVFVPAPWPCSAETLATYARVSADELCWTRGFRGRAALPLEFELEVEPFIASFEQSLARWIDLHPPLPPRAPRSDASRASTLLEDRCRRIVRRETHFVAVVLRALHRWQTDPEAVVLWDIDETLLGSGVKLRFLRPSSEAVLVYAARRFPGLGQGVLSSLAPASIAPASEFIRQCLSAAGVEGSLAPQWRYSFRPALDLFEGIEWVRMRAGLRAAGLPDCGPGGQERGWPLYPTEFSRVLTLHALRARGLRVKVVDNDLNACFDADHPAENQVGAEARAWLGAMLGDTCAVGPHWWPQETEEWILELIG